MVFAQRQGDRRAPAPNNFHSGLERPPPSSLLTTVCRVKHNMSHLPPRPDFAEPTSRRPDSRTHYYSARPQPMAPEHAYTHPPPRERERDVYVARSPPRSRHPPRMADSYVASDRDRDREAYRDSYDRRDDDRHRDAFRDRERRDRERDFYPPPTSASADYRYREDSRAWPPRDARDARDSRDRGRNWDPRPWTQSAEIDRRPRGLRQREVVECDRRWDSRPPRSPPPRGECRYCFSCLCFQVSCNVLSIPSAPGTLR